MTDFQDRMAVLRQQFLVRTEGDMTLFVAAMARGDLAAIRSISHRLAGIAGIFGCHGLGTAAREVEEVLDRRRPQSEIERSGAALVDQFRLLLTTEA